MDIQRAGLLIIPGETTVKKEHFFHALKILFWYPRLNGWPAISAIHFCLPVI